MRLRAPDRGEARGLLDLPLIRTPGPVFMPARGLDPVPDFGILLGPTAVDPDRHS